MESSTTSIVEIEEIDDEWLDEVVGGSPLGPVFALACGSLDAVNPL
ncbi:MAG TPA: hypothetical protein VF230_02985 [Acidimicrobiales bacterium]